MPSGQVSQHQVAAFTTPVDGTTNSAADVLANDNALVSATNAHDADATIHRQVGALASRPAAGVAGRTWFATDTLLDSVDTGSAWRMAAYGYALANATYVDHPTYGALGDGTTDDAAAINAAFQAAKAKRGPVVFTPGKTYRCSTSVGSASEADVLDGVTVVGWGATLQSDLVGADNAPALRLFGNHVAVEGLTITYTTMPDTTTWPDAATEGHALVIGGVTATAATNVRVEAVTVTGAYNAGIRPYNVTDCKVVNCTVTDTLGDGIFVGDSGGDILVQGCTLARNGDDQIFVEVGPAAAACRRVRILGNACADGHAKAIGVAGVRGAVILGNTIERTWGPAVQYEWNDTDSAEGTTAVTVALNTILDAGTLYGAGEKHASVSSVPHGIYAVGDAARVFRGVVLALNTISGAAGAGTLVGYHRNFMGALNVIEDCGDAGISVGVDAATDDLSMQNFGVMLNVIDGVAGNALYASHATDGRVAGNVGAAYGAAGGATQRALRFTHTTRVVGDGNQFNNSNGAEETFSTDAANTSSPIMLNSFASANGNELGTSAFARLGVAKVGVGTALPTDGDWALGDTWRFTNADAKGDPMEAQCTTAGTGSAAKWRYTKLVPGASSDYGDTSPTYTLGASGATTLRFATTLTTTRTLTLVTAGLGPEWDGTRISVLRTGAGAPPLNVNTDTPTALTALALSQSADFEFDHANATWHVLRKGGL